MLIQREQPETGLPDNWEVRMSNSKKMPYYFNPTTKESQWEPPPGTDSEKIKNYMAQYHSSAAPPNVAPDKANGQENNGKIRAAHLLVKHRDSRRPSSWREAEITRSKEEAMNIIRGHQKRIQNGETSLADLAVRESDCPSARKKGDLYVVYCLI